MNLDPTKCFLYQIEQEARIFTKANSVITNEYIIRSKPIKESDMTHKQEMIFEVDGKRIFPSYINSPNLVKMIDNTCKELIHTIKELESYKHIRLESDTKYEWNIKGRK